MTKEPSSDVEIEKPDMAIEVDTAPNALEPEIQAPTAPEPDGLPNTAAAFAMYNAAIGVGDMPAMPLIDDREEEQPTQWIRPAETEPHSVGPSLFPLPNLFGDDEEEEPAPIRGEWQEVSGRDVAALLDPRPTIVVGSIGRRDEVGLATIIWATPVSHDPAMVVFALRERSHTMGCIQKNGCFSLNIMPANKEGVYISEQCGTRTGYQFNKITLIRHHIIEVEYDKTETVEVEIPKQGLFSKSTVEEAEKTTHLKRKLPIIDAATSWLACDVERIEEVGDHLLVIGRVLRAETCAVRDERGLLIPQDVLECIQHGCYAKVEILEDQDV